MPKRLLFSLKFTGLLTGLIAGGWRGALIGFTLGYLLDRSLKRYLNPTHNPPFGKRYRSKDEQLFFQLTYQVLGFLAKADGQVSAQEICTVERIMSSMALTPEERYQAIEAFNTGKALPEPPQHLIKAFKRRFKQRTGKKLEWLHYQFQLLYAEGRAHTDLIEQLGMIAFYIGMQPEQFQITRQHYRKAWHDQYKSYQSGQDEQRGQGEQEQHNYRQRYTYSHSNGPSLTRELQAAYQLIGVPPGCDLNVLKKAYRQKISRVHPDKLAGQNASDADYALAKERTQQLQAAYQLIRKLHHPSRQRS